MVLTREPAALSRAKGPPGGRPGRPGTGQRNDT